MIKKITCFLPAGDPEDLKSTLNEINGCGQVGNIFLLVVDPLPLTDLPANVQQIIVPSLFSSDTIRKMALHTNPITP